MTLLADNPMIRAGIWRLLLPLGAAAVAVYFLLPRPRRRSALLGALAGAAALVLGGAQLFRIEGSPTPETLLFFAFSALAVGGGVLMITQSNPARAALCFALVVLSVCGLFLLQAAPFLMAATIIIYAGAIIVTFLFVLMLAQQTGFSDADDRSREPFLATFAGFLLLGALLLLLDRAFPDPAAFDGLIERAAAIAKESSVDEMRSQLSRKPTLIEVARAEGPHLQGSAHKLSWESTIEDLDEKVRAQTTDAASLRAELVRLAAIGRAAQAERRGGKLPAENVASLGRLLFSDYLLAVEMGGTLLLVATIGAIAITHRRERRPA